MLARWLVLPRHARPRTPAAERSRSAQLGTRGLETATWLRAVAPLAQRGVPENSAYYNLRVPLLRLACRSLDPQILVQLPAPGRRFSGTDVDVSPRERWGTPERRRTHGAWARMPLCRSYCFEGLSAPARGDRAAPAPSQCGAKRRSDARSLRRRRTSTNDWIYGFSGSRTI